MSCVLCASRNQSELAAEINIHFPGLQHVDKPGVFVFPKILVCLDCGFSQFTMPESEVALVARRVPQTDASKWPQKAERVAPRLRIAL